MAVSVSKALQDARILSLSLLEQQNKGTLDFNEKEELKTFLTKLIDHENYNNSKALSNYQVKQMKNNIAQQINAIKQYQAT